MRRSPLLTFAGVVLAAFVSMTSTPSAQTATGQITGTVRDATGAVMSGVKVVVTNQQTGLTRQTTTSDERRLRHPAAPGRRLRGHRRSRPGSRRPSIPTSRSPSIRSSASTCSSTPATSPRPSKSSRRRVALDTGSASIGHTITEKQVTELPLNGRNFLQLLFLGAGAVETGGEQGGMRQGVGNAISIMGARPTSNNFMIDGTANIDTALGTPAAVLSVDAIQEFKEQTTTYSAEYGFSSNQINLVSKTGHERAARHGLRVLPERRAGTRGTSSTTRRRRDAEAGSEAVRVRRRRAGDAARATTGGTARSSWSTTRARGSTAASTNFYTVPTPDELAGRFTHDDHRSGDRRSRSRTTPSRSRASRGSRSWRIRNSWFPAPNTSAAQGNYQAVRTLPQVAGPVHDSRRSGSRRSSAACSSATRTRPTRTRTDSNMIEAGDRVFVQDTTNWQVSHTLADPEQRSSTSSGSAASTRAPTSTASRARRRTSTSSA